MRYTKELTCATGQGPVTWRNIANELEDYENEPPILPSVAFCFALFSFFN